MWGNSGPVTRASLHSSPATKAIQRLQSDKVAVVDGVIAEMLKAAEQEITPFLIKNFSVLF